MRTNASCWPRAARAEVRRSPARGAQVAADVVGVARGCAAAGRGRWPSRRGGPCAPSRRRSAPATPCRCRGCRRCASAPPAAARPGWPAPARGARGRGTRRGACSADEESKAACTRLGDRREVAGDAAGLRGQLADVGQRRAGPGRRRRPRRLGDWRRTSGSAGRSRAVDELDRPVAEQRRAEKMIATGLLRAAVSVPLSRSVDRDPVVRARERDRLDPPDLHAAQQHRVADLQAADVRNRTCAR